MRLSSFGDGAGGGLCVYFGIGMRDIDDDVVWIVYDTGFNFYDNFVNKHIIY